MDDENSFTSRLAKTSEKMPLYPIGVLGFGLVAAYGLYKFKSHKGRPSLYLIQLRLAAQGTVIGILGVGILYNIYKESVASKSESR